MSEAISFEDRVGSCESIDHPAQPNWMMEALDLPNEYQRGLITRRFASAGSEVAGKMISAVNSAILISSSLRDVREKSTVGLLSGVLTEDQFNDDYRQLAGNPSGVVDLIKSFMKATTSYDEVRAQQPKHLNYSRLAIELGGIRQAGDWSNTGELDELARAIPLGVEMLDDRDVEIEVLDHPSQHKIAYRYQGLWVNGEDQTDQFGLIRRRRALADFELNGQSNQDQKRVWQLYKESLGLLVLTEIDPSDRQIIEEDMALDSEGAVGSVSGNTLVRGGQNNTRVASLAGDYFHALTSAEARLTREYDRTVLPISAHMVFKARLSDGEGS